MDKDLGQSQQSRREFLEKAGKLALYTTPTITMLMHPGAEAIASQGAKEIAVVNSNLSTLGKPSTFEEWLDENQVVQSYLRENRHVYRVLRKNRRLRRRVMRSAEPLKRIQHLAGALDKKKT